mgnify:CR=1 FL=1
MIRRAAVPRMIAFLACAWLLALLPGVPAAGTADGALAFTSVPDTVKPYAPGTLTLSLPEAGELRVYALIGQERIPLYPPRQTDQGELTLPFEGLSAAGEPLPRGSALIQAELRAAVRCTRPSRLSGC